MYGNQTTYSVTNAYGQNIGSSFDYYQAQQIAQNAQRMGSCSYVTNLNNSFPGQNGCQIMPGGNAYGASFYRVIDRAGRIINNSCSYQEALQAVQTDARCYQ